MDKIDENNLKLGDLIWTQVFIQIVLINKKITTCAKVVAGFYLQSNFN